MDLNIFKSKHIFYYILLGQVKACGPVPHLENGYAQFSILPFQHGVSVELNCRDTYTMIGNNVITCIDGTWTELPTCVGENTFPTCVFDCLQFLKSIDMFRTAHANPIIY